MQYLHGPLYLDKLPAGFFCITSGADSLRIVSALLGSFSRALLLQGPIALLHLRGGTLVTIVNLGDYHRFWWPSAKVHLYRLSLTLGDEDYRALLLVVLLAHFLLVRGEPKNKIISEHTETMSHLQLMKNKFRIKLGYIQASSVWLLVTLLLRNFTVWCVWWLPCDCWLSLILVLAIVIVIVMVTSWHRCSGNSPPPWTNHFYF